MSIRNISSRFTVTWDHPPPDSPKSSRIARWPSRTTSPSPEKPLPRRPQSPPPSSSSSSLRHQMSPTKSRSASASAQMVSGIPIRHSQLRYTSSTSVNNSDFGMRAGSVYSLEDENQSRRTRYHGGGTNSRESVVVDVGSPTIRPVSRATSQVALGGGEVELPAISPTKSRKIRDFSHLSRGASPSPGSGPASRLPVSSSTSQLQSSPARTTSLSVAHQRSVSQPQSSSPASERERRYMIKPPSPESMSTQGVVWGTRKKEMSASSSGGSLREMAVEEEKGGEGMRSLRRKGSFALDEILMGGSGAGGTPSPRGTR